MSEPVVAKERESSPEVTTPEGTSPEETSPEETTDTETEADNTTTEEEGVTPVPEEKEGEEEESTEPTETTTEPTTEDKTDSLSQYSLDEGSEPDTSAVDGEPESVAETAVEGDGESDKGPGIMMDQNFTEDIDATTLKFIEIDSLELNEQGEEVNIRIPVPVVREKKERIKKTIINKRSVLKKKTEEVHSEEKVDVTESMEGSGEKSVTKSAEELVKKAGSKVEAKKKKKKKKKKKGEESPEEDEDGYEMEEFEEEVWVDVVTTTVKIKKINEDGEIEEVEKDIVQEFMVGEQPKKFKIVRVRKARENGEEYSEEVEMEEEEIEEGVEKMEGEEVEREGDEKTERKKKIIKKTILKKVYKPKVEGEAEGEAEEIEEEIDEEVEEEEEKERELEKKSVAVSSDVEIIVIEAREGQEEEEEEKVTEEWDEEESERSEEEKKKILEEGELEEDEKEAKEEGEKEEGEGEAEEEEEEEQEEEETKREKIVEEEEMGSEPFADLPREERFVRRFKFHRQVLNMHLVKNRLLLRKLAKFLKKNNIKLKKKSDDVFLGSEEQLYSELMEFKDEAVFVATELKRLNTESENLFKERSEKSQILDELLDTLKQKELSIASRVDQRQAKRFFKGRSLEEMIELQFRQEKWLAKMRFKKYMAAARLQERKDLFEERTGMDDEEGFLEIDVIQYEKLVKHREQLREKLEVKKHQVLKMRNRLREVVQEHAHVKLKAHDMMERLHQMREEIQDKKQLRNEIRSRVQAIRNERRKLLEKVKTVRKREGIEDYPRVLKDLLNVNRKIKKKEEVIDSEMGSFKRKCNLLKQLTALQGKGELRKRTKKLKKND